MKINGFASNAITALGNLKYDASVKALAQEVPVTVARYMAEMLDFGSTELKNKLNDLITKNLLFEDLDLIKQGNADQEKAGRVVIVAAALDLAAAPA